jgi:dihydropteroate synthase
LEKIKKIKKRRVMSMFDIRILDLKSKEELKDEILTQVNPTNIGAVKVSNKGTFYNVLVKNVKSVVANVIKQEMLSIGTDAVVAKGALDLSVDRCNVILVGNIKHFKQLAVKIKAQPFSLKYFGNEVLDKIDKFNRKKFNLSIKGETYTLSEDKTYIMGILNVTPDSFSDGGEFISLDNAIKRVEVMIKEGADFIDIGGESTRPGAEEVSLNEELKRVVPVIEAIAKEFPHIPISIDTYKSKVAKEAVSAGASMINDISGLHFDTEMAKVVAEEKIPVILMHIKGTPKNMQKNPVYDNLLNEIFDYFNESLSILEKAGGDIENVVIDPGIGFGKTFEHNLIILNRLKEFKSFGLPVLIGASRKSFIGAILNKKNPKHRVLGSLSVAAISSLKGAKILRVHDVKETYEVLKVADAVKNKKID